LAQAKKVIDETGRPAAGGRRMLQNWEINPALSGVRDEEGLGQLSEAEQASWKKFWSHVAESSRL
jgi:hypothetical protein